MRIRFDYGYGGMIEVSTISLWKSKIIVGGERAFITFGENPIEDSEYKYIAHIYFPCCQFSMTVDYHKHSNKDLALMILHSIE